MEVVSVGASNNESDQPEDSKRLLRISVSARRGIRFSQNGIHFTVRLLNDRNDRKEYCHENFSEVKSLTVSSMILICYT